MNFMSCLGIGANYASREEDQAAWWCNSCSSPTYIASNSTTSDTNALCKLINCYRSHLLQYQQCCRFLLYSCFVQYFSLILWLFLFEFPYMHGTECLFIVVRKWMWHLTSNPPVLLLQVLYHVLGCVPSYHSRIVPLLNELCEGLEPENLAEVLHLWCFISIDSGLIFSRFGIASIRVVLTCFITVVLIIRPSMVCTRSLWSCVLHV